MTQTRAERVVFGGRIRGGMVGGSPASKYHV